MNDMDIQKAESLFRLRINSALDIFSLYGMKVYIPGTVESIMMAYREFIKPFIKDNIDNQTKG